LPASVVVRTAQVVPAVGADQLALVASEAMRAGGANLAMMVYRRLIDFC